MTVVLIAALGLPGCGAVAALLTARAPSLFPSPQIVVRGAAAGAGAAWAVLLIGGGAQLGSWFVADELVAASGIGTALVAGGLAPPTRLLASLTAGSATVAAWIPGVAVAPGGASAAVATLVVLAAVIAAGASLAEGAPLRSIALLGAGALSGGATLAALDTPLATGATVGPVIFVGLAIAVVAVAMAAGFRAAPGVVVLVPGVLALMLAAAPLVERRVLRGLDLSVPDGVALVLALAGTAASGIARRGPTRGAPALSPWVPVSLVLWAAAVAAVNVPGARLLAAAATLVFVLRVSAAPVVSVPGAAAAAAGIVVLGGPVAVGLGALGATSGALLTRLGDQRPPARRPVRTRPLVAAGRVAPPGPERDPAFLVSAALGGWLLVAPGSWGWALAPAGAYGPGLAVALAAGLLAAALARAGGLGLADPAAMRASLAWAPVLAPGWLPRPRWQVALALLPLGAAVIVLVASLVLLG